MILKRLGLASLVIGLGIGAAGCTDGYGYSGVNVGYASGYGDGYGGYGNGYGGNGYYGAGYGGVGAGYFGWYGDYYYPGNGVYVYDRYRRPYRWNDGQRRYWEGRRGNYRGDRNWNGFDRSTDRGGYRGAYRNDGNRGDRGGYLWDRAALSRAERPERDDPVVHAAHPSYRWRRPRLARQEPPELNARDGRQAAGRVATSPFDTNVITATSCWLKTVIRLLKIPISGLVAD